MRNECESEKSSLEADLLREFAAQKAAIQNKQYIEIQRQMLELTKKLTDRKTEEITLSKSHCF
jgi:hypothetical protein